MIRRLACLVVCLAACAVPAARAQRVDTARVGRDTLRADTLRAVRDSVRVGDVVVVRTDSLAAPASSRTLREPVRFSARDRLTFVFDSTATDRRLGDVATLTGDARVAYGKQTLSAHVVSLLVDRDEVRARGLRVDTGMVGRPTFAEGTNTVTSEEIAYNLRTERGRFVQARTRLDDGFVRAQTVALGQDSTVYARGAVFTTCPCIDDPSYSLRADRMKIVDGKRIFTGPIQLFLFNIATPLVLPFGFLPATEGRRAGPLAPTYGEDYRGFYLQNLGWYWPLSPYLDLQVTGSLWSRGSFELRPRVRYARRYRMTGSVEVAGGLNRTGEREDPGYAPERVLSLRWTHSQTVSLRTSFNANVDLSSTGYLRGNSQTLVDRTRQDIGSTINYSTRWPRAGRALTVALSQRQSLATGAATLRLPDVSFSQTERRPFARRGVVRGAPRWYESISYRYSGTLANGFDFRPATGDSSGVAWYEALIRPSLYREATGNRFGTPFTLNVRHDVPIAASFTVNGLPGMRGLRANVTPAIQYVEQWVNQTQRAVARDTVGVDVRPVTGFAAVRQVTASLSANTTAYGTFPLRLATPLGRIDGLRHTLRPSLGVAFAPDYAAAPFGYVRETTYRERVGGQVVDRIARTPLLPSIPTVGTAALTYGLDNVFETRRVRVDTAGEATRTPFTLLTLSLSGAVNAAADSFRVSPVAFSARTQIGRLDLSANGSFSPYRRRAGGIGEEPRFDVAFDGLPLGRVQRFALSGATTFASRRRGDARPTQRAAFDQYLPGQAAGVPLSGYPEARAPFVPVIGAAPYADFSIPWSLTLDVSYTYGENLYGGRAARALVTNSRFDLNLTPRWKVQGSTGLDLTRREVSTSSLALLRDFDCWEMSMSWVPFGAYRSYGFNLQVKSGKLRELLRVQVPRQDPRRVLSTVVR